MRACSGPLLARRGDRDDQARSADRESGDAEHTSEDVDGGVGRRGGLGLDVTLLSSASSSEWPCPSAALASVTAIAGAGSSGSEPSAAGDSAQAVSPSTQVCSTGNSSRSPAASSGSRTWIWKASR
ncbi:hypothetical protein [Agromyces marinus]|uniref:hypothetical protein n=1 Tax=Agromyces marinus TaxID=1389020 RepID=UPI0025745C70|nr:hypothetical protein [Agromyces marinus]